LGKPFRDIFNKDCKNNSQTKHYLWIKNLDSKKDIEIKFLRSLLSEFRICGSVHFK
jgi:hypothetical protein